MHKICIFKLLKAIFYIFCLAFISNSIYSLSIFLWCFKTIKQCWITRMKLLLSSLVLLEESVCYDWASFPLWLSLFILSVVISLLFPSSILDTYLPGGFIFQCYVFLPFHTVHEVLKARILMWLTIIFSSGTRFVRTLHHDLPILGGPKRHGS